MQILRYPALTGPEFAGCVSAFWDSLAAELNAATSCLKRLEGSAKGAGFLHEVGLDRARYGCLVILDRWRYLNAAFGRSLPPDSAAPLLQITEEAESRIRHAEALLQRVNQTIDAAEAYHGELVEAALLGLQQLRRIFQQESQVAEGSSHLGQMALPEQATARRIFLADLARR